MINLIYALKSFVFILMMSVVILLMVGLREAAATQTTEIVRNGNFNKAEKYWRCKDCKLNTDESHGNYLSLGAVGSSATEMLLAQVITLPENSRLKLSFDYRLITADHSENDYFLILLGDYEGEVFHVLDTLYADIGSTDDWTTRTYELSAVAGEATILAFAVANDSQNLTTVDIDNVTLVAKKNKHYTIFSIAEIEQARATVYWSMEKLSGKLQLQLWELKGNNWQKLQSRRVKSSAVVYTFKHLQSETTYAVRAKFPKIKPWVSWRYFKTAE